MSPLPPPAPARRRALTSEAPPAPPSRLNFINISHPAEMKNQSNKRRVHKHAMQDIGVSRRNRPPGRRFAAQFMESTDNAALRGDACTRCRTELSVISLPVPAERTGPSSHTPSPGTDAVLHSPLGLRAQKLNHFLFRRNSAFCMKIRELCFSLAMFDDGAYCLAQAETALYDDEKPGGYLLPHQENAVSLRYYNRSVTHVNQQMQSVEACKASNYGMVGAVLGLASYDVSVGNMTRWLMHMEGLKTLLNSHDVAVFKSSFFMLSLLWTDTTGSLVLDQEPQFYIPLEVMQPYHEPVESACLAQNLTALRSLDPQLEDIASILMQLTGLVRSYELKETSDDDDHNCTVYCITRARVSYLFLQVQRADSQGLLDKSTSKPSVLGESVRLAVLVFLLHLTGFVPRLGNCAEGHAARLGEILVRCDWHWGDGLSELQLWALTLAAVATGDARRRETLVDRIDILLMKMGISWEAAPAALRQIAWVNGVLDKRWHEMTTGVPTKGQ